MTSTNTNPLRIGRAGAAFLVAALVMLPISAQAAPADSGIEHVFNGNGNGNGNGNENPGNTGNAPGNSGNAPGQQGSDPGQATPNGVAAGFGAAPPAAVPSGVVPTTGGLGSVAVTELPAHVGAAVMLFDTPSEPVEPPNVDPAAGVSDSVLGVLDPVLPPILGDVASSPLVVFAALLEAMASSGQALVIPFLAGVAGLLAPAWRRHLIDEALGDA